ncbi:MAG: outer membrane beta-barrel protein [Bacteroidota bacterium]
MKSSRVFIIAFCSFVFINLNAQVFVGGSVGFNTSNSEHEGATMQKSSSYNLGLRPSAGKFLSEKLAIGLALDISLSGSKTDVNTETVTKSSGIGVSPFLRYYAIKWNKFSVFGQGNIGVEFSNSSVKTGGTTNDGPKQTRAYLSIFPGLAYNISEKLLLETSLNILSLGYNYVTTKEGTLKDKGSNLNIGAGLSNIVSLNAITIGAIYKF